MVVLFTVVDTEGADWGYETAWLFPGLGSLVCAMVWVWVYVPEPSRRNYAEMGEMYTNGSPPGRCGSMSRGCSPRSSSRLSRPRSCSSCSECHI